MLQSNLGSDADGGPSGGVTYKWFDNGVAINNATTSTYAVTSSDLGHAITVQAQYVDGKGFSDTSTSPATGNVIAPPVAVAVRVREASPEPCEG